LVVASDLGLGRRGVIGLVASGFARLRRAGVRLAVVRKRTSVGPTGPRSGSGSGVVLRRSDMKIGLAVDQIVRSRGSAPRADVGFAISLSPGNPRSSKIRPIVRVGSHIGVIYAWYCTDLGYI